MVSRPLFFATTLLLLVAGAAAVGDAASPASESAQQVATVVATVETQPVPHDGDAADDPAIWVHPTRPERSTIIGTDKKGGLAVYDVSGKQIQYLADGRMNNVDLRTGFRLGGRQVTLVTASNRTDDTLAVYRVDVPSRRLVNAASGKIRMGIEVYGACMYRSGRSGRFYSFVNSRDGEVEQWELFERGGRVDARKVRSFSLESTTEGCVADDRLGAFYIGEEERGIWKFGAEPTSGTARRLFDSTGEGGHLTAEVEGLTIAYGRGARGYLIASSQGSDSFVVYRRDGTNGYVKTFKIEAGDGIDAVSHTDGIDVTTASLGPSFPRGVFVAQDHKNDRGNQNFKLVPWPAIGLR